MNADKVHGVPRVEWDAAVARLAESRVAQGLPRTVVDENQLRKIGVLIAASKQDRAS